MSLVTRHLSLAATCLVLFAAFAGCSRAAEPKRILLVTVTTGFRHSSIETGEKVLRELAAKTGEFTIVSTSEHPDYPKYGTAGAPADPTEQVRKVLATYMSAEALRQFDGVFLDSTTGELPLPDKAAFFKWVADGHAVMGVHAASDSMHETAEYAAMLGGEFAGHGLQATGVMVNFDPAHPATSEWGRSREVFDELYLFRSNYDRTKVHSLLSMTVRPADGLGPVNGVPPAGAPMWSPMSWTKMYGKGRVFYTALGHREDVWDPAWKDADGQRKNAPEVAVAFQQHLLGGIRWALGLATGDVKPQEISR